MYNPINDLIAQQSKKAARSKRKPRSSCSLRKTILDLAADANSNLPVERHITTKSVITVAERSLTRTAGLEKQTRIFAAYRDVASFVLFATSGHTAGAPSNRSFTNWTSLRDAPAQHVGILAARGTRSLDRG